MKRIRKFKPLCALRSIIDWIIASSWRTFIAIFLLAFIVRLEQLRQIPEQFLVPTDQWELGSIAISLMQTGQFADPYMISTGPTAHLPPLYPLIYSLIYRLFGLTTAAGYATWLLIIFSSATLYALLPRLSDKLGSGKQAGLIGGFAGALLVKWSGHGEYLTAITLGLLMVSFLHRWTKDKATLVSSFLLGGAIGLAFLIQPALLTVIIGFIIFELWWRRNGHKWVQISVLRMSKCLFLRSRSCPIAIPNEIISHRLPSKIFRFMIPGNSN